MGKSKSDLYLEPERDLGHINWVQYTSEEGVSFSSCAFSQLFQASSDQEKSFTEPFYLTIKLVARSHYHGIFIYPEEWNKNRDK
jgi:hypothetical protein